MNLIHHIQKEIYIHFILDQQVNVKIEFYLTQLKRQKEKPYSVK